ncbi:MAG: tetraether lipid synthase Tes [Candidatus Njordarchaeales archaeon]
MTTTQIKIIQVGERSIKLGPAPKPELKENEKLVMHTRSVCPECYRLLPAIIFERDNKIWIRKVCPEHGETEEIYWGDAQLFYKAMRFWAPEVKIENTNVPMKAPCPFSCGLCPVHKNQTALANIVLTNRCDLSCWYCFFYAEKAGFVYEPSIEQIREMIRILRRQGPFHPNAVQLTGGEPTLREDLIEIVKMLREEGITHIQLNTNGIKFARLWLEKGPEEAVKYARELREAGVNTVYLSFDGVTPKTNPKNHWEIPYIFETFRRAQMTSVVLVPVVIRGINTHEIGDIIRFAAKNIDIVRGVNFQPVSITGSVPRHEREKIRITIPDVIKLIEEQTDGEIPRDAWYPVPWTYPFSDFIEALSKKPAIKMANHPACGMATYVIPVYEKVNGRRIVKKFVPITDFVDVEGLWEFFKEKAEELRNGKSKLRVLLSLVWNLRKFIDAKRAPKHLKIRRLLIKIILKRDYHSLGEFHYKALFLGMMHFQDTYNYDVMRVERCNIHYLTPDGRVIPFCAFNVLPDLYRDYIQKKYAIPLDKWAKLHGEKTIGPAIKYKRDVKKLANTELYRKTYEDFLKNS